MLRLPLRAPSTTSSITSFPTNINCRRWPVYLKIGKVGKDQLGYDLKLHTTVMGSETIRLSLSVFQ